MGDPVKVERVGGTAATNPWHNHRVMLVSPKVVRGIEWAISDEPDAPIVQPVQAFLDAFHAAPRVHLDDDAIRWLCERQADTA
jgi:hypothetical protein